METIDLLDLIGIEPTDNDLYFIGRNEAGEPITHSQPKASPRLIARLHDKDAQKIIGQAAAKYAQIVRKHARKTYGSVDAMGDAISETYNRVDYQEDVDLQVIAMCITLEAARINEPHGSGYPLVAHERCFPLLDELLKERSKQVLHLLATQSALSLH
jgi:hypothetical protein